MAVHGPGDPGASWSRSPTAARSWRGPPANANPTVDIEGPLRRLTSGWPDVVAASSSRGPALTMEIKPDIAAPGPSILSSVVNDTTGAVNPAGLFNQLSGTSMATPHVTALAALTQARHPDWTPAQIKSALMNTAQTSMSLDIEGPSRRSRSTAARPRERRAAGRPAADVRPAERLVRAPAPGREQSGSRSRRPTCASAAARRLLLNVRQLIGNPAVDVDADADVHVEEQPEHDVRPRIATAGAPAGDYEGFLEVTGGGQTYTIPYFVRIQDPSSRRTCF